MGLMDMRDMAQKMRHMGVKGDTDLVHVNEREKAMLKAAGGSGTRNPHTGLLQYEDGGDGGLGGHDGRSSLGGSRGTDNAPGGLGGDGFGGFGGGMSGADAGWSTGGYSLGLDGSLRGPLGFDAPGFASSPQSRAMAEARGLVGDYDGDPFDIAGIAHTRAMAAINMGDVKSLRDLGYNEAATSLTKAFSPSYSGGLLGAITGSIGEPDTVQTPQRSLTEVTRKGWATPDADPLSTEYHATPKYAFAQLANFFSPLDYAKNSLVNGSPVSPAAALSVPAGPLGLLGFANSVTKTVQNARQMANAGVSTSSNGDSSPSTRDGGSTNYLAESTPRVGNEYTGSIASLNTIDPMAWFAQRRGLL